MKQHELMTTNNVSEVLGMLSEPGDYLMAKVTKTGKKVSKLKIGPHKMTRVQQKSGKGVNYISC